MDDPMEKQFAMICRLHDIRCERADQSKGSSGLDFFLPDYDVYVEVKRFHSPRIAEQMARRPNVVAIQGDGAMDAFAKILSTSAKLGVLR